MAKVFDIIVKCHKTKNEHLRKIKSHPRTYNTEQFV